MRRPLLALAAAFVAGCLAADPAATRPEALVLVGFTVVLLAVSVLVRPAEALLALGGAAFALGVLAAEVEGLRFEAGGLKQFLESESDVGQPMQLVGHVRGDARPRAGRLRFKLDVDEIGFRGQRSSVDGRVLVEVGGATKWPTIVDGERVALWATLRLSRREEGVRRGVVAQGYCKSARLLEQREGSDAGVLRRNLSAARAALRARLTQAILTGPERGLVLAMVLGDRSELDEHTAEAFKASGTYHVLALSGAQVALVAALIVGALRWLRVGPGAEAVVTSGMVWFYAMLVGGDVPIVRAAHGLGGPGRARLRSGGRCRQSPRPCSIRASDGVPRIRVGRGLSALLRSHVGHTGPGRPSRPRSPSVATQGRARRGRVGGRAGRPLTAPGRALSPPGSGGPPSEPGRRTSLRCGAPCGSGDAGTHALGVRHVPGGRHRVGRRACPAALRRSRAAGSLAGRAGGGADAPDSRGPRRRPGAPRARLASTRAGAAGREPSRSPRRAAAPGRGWAASLERAHVGQGDCLLLRSPSGRVLLVDTGGSWNPRYDVGERRVAPVLWSAGIRRLDVLVLTHAHADHVGGAAFLLSAFGIDEVWEGPAVPRIPSWRRLDGVLRGARVARRAVFRGVSVEWDGVALELLGPAAKGPPPREVRNEDSVVMSARLGEVSFLLTGDVQGAAEDALLSARALVVKVPHHGSRTSSGPRLVASTRPRVAIASLGARNPFGYPHQEVVSRYEDAGALLLRTDRDGTVEVATDGQRLWVRTSGEALERRIR